VAEIYITYRYCQFSGVVKLIIVLHVSVWELVLYTWEGKPGGYWK
jgi:hypothetical protein